MLEWSIPASGWPHRHRFEARVQRHARRAKVDRSRSPWIWRANSTPACILHPHGSRATYCSYAVKKDGIWPGLISRSRPKKVAHWSSYRSSDSRAVMKTSPRICNRKKRFATRAAAETVAAHADLTLRAYKCELCRQYHLTSRTKGMKTPLHEMPGRRGAKAR